MGFKLLFEFVIALCTTNILLTANNFKRPTTFLQKCFNCIRIRSYKRYSKTYRIMYSVTKPVGLCSNLKKQSKFLELYKIISMKTYGNSIKQPFLWHNVKLYAHCICFYSTQQVQFVHENMAAEHLSI